MAEHFVKRYLNLANTVLQEAGWETSRAEKVLEQLGVRTSMHA